MRIVEPQTQQEFESYYHLRWLCLRKPWGKPVGTEKDELEDSSIHAMLIDDDNIPVAVGRLHLNKPDEAQMRYMAVAEQERGKKYGDRILRYLEQVAKKRNCTSIILQARDIAVNFYKRNGFVVKEKSFLMWDEIQHYLMEKKI